jgi:hypothetical protein
MSTIWANYLIQSPGCVVPSAGPVNVGDVIQWRGGGPTSTVTEVIPAVSGTAFPMQEPNPHDRLTIAPHGTLPYDTIWANQLVNFIWLS